MAELTPEQFARVEQLYFEASQLPPTGWASFLDASCPDDSLIRQEVLSMLAQHQKHASIQPLHHAISAELSGFDPQSWVGQSIGPYQIVELLGQGGMGIVFRAEQQRPVRRTVALKLIRPGMDSPQIIARFNSERQALALMSHANVARVFDAGTTPDGRHYFVMEYVPGEPITTYCDKNHRSTKARLDLFMQVCDAVQHAHQKGIIHRDLKPSNVLVTVQDGAPVPKVIDFGIAKAVDQAIPGMTMVTQAYQPVGTPEYMSPEQATSGGADLDTRTDVYSLGVLLYELLTGALPFESGSSGATTFDDIRRIIREVDPPLPSSRLSGMGATAHTIAKHRQAGASELAKSLRGDLDWITMKAIEKDRTRRYGSPAEFSADVKRFLDYEPVSAGPPTLRYRMRKFVRRHRVGVVATSLVIVALVGGIVGTTMQLLRARRAEADALAQKTRAEARFNDVRKLAGAFMFDVDDTLQTAGPTRAREKLVNTSIEYLDKLAAEAGDDLKLLGELCRGYMRVGNVQYYPGFASLGDRRGALRSYQRALEIGQKRLALDPADRDSRNNLAACWDCIAEAQYGLEQLAPSLDSFQSAQKLYEAIAKEAPGDVTASRNVSLVTAKIGDTYRRMRDYDSAEKYLDQAQAHRETLLASNPGNTMIRRDVALGHSALGSLQQDRGRVDRALERYEKSLAECRSMLASAPDNPVYQRDVSRALDQITNANLLLGRAAAAVAAAQECVEIRQRAVAADPSNARAVEDLGDAHKLAGDTYITTGRANDALPSYQQCLEVRQRLLSSSPESVEMQVDVAITHVAIGDEHRVEGRWEACVESTARGAELLDRVLAIDPGNLTVRTNLGLAHASIAECLFRLGKHDEAFVRMQLAIDVRTAGAGPDKPPVTRRGLASLHTRKARLFMEQRRAEEGADSFQRAVDIAAGLVNVNSNDRRAANELLTAQLGLGDALIKSGKWEQAVPILDGALRSAQTARDAEPTSMNASDSLRMAHAAMGELEIARDRLDAAETQYRAAIEIAQKTLESNPGRAGTRRALESHETRLKEILVAATQPANADP